MSYVFQMFSFFKCVCYVFIDKLCKSVKIMSECAAKLMLGDFKEEEGEKGIYLGYKR